MAMQNEPTPAYMVVQLHVKNHEEYRQRYVMPVLPMIEKLGAKVVAVSANLKVLEGKWGGNWTVILRFPSVSVAEKWFNSVEYQPFKDLRINELTNGGTAILVEGFDRRALGI